jgi:hypothetical protein
MALEVTSLDELNTDTVNALFATFTQYMQERHPEVELTRGVFHDLVLYFNSVLNATVRENIARVRQSNSLLQINANPALADDTLVDRVLSNYNLVRDAGSAAVGDATIVLNLPISTRISAGITFSADDVKFRPTNEFIALPPGSVPTQVNERVMIAVGDDTYAVNITVAATTVGLAGNIRRGTSLVPDSVPNNMLSAFAAVDFVSGRAPLANEDYVARLADALASKTVGGRQSYAAAIRGQTAFKNIPHLSILGCGDAEQMRDQHSLLPISGGGKVDIYVQSHSNAQEREHLLSASYVGPGATGTIWQLVLGREIAGGIYEIARIVKPLDLTSTGYAMTQDIRGVDLTDLDFVPDIVSYEEGAYSRYQTAVIRFEDTDTAPTGLTPSVSRAQYAVTTVGLPLITDVQDYLSSRDVRSRSADVLVKAAVPCFTKISFAIRKEANTTELDVTPIKQAVVDAVAKVGFSGQLHASLISGAIHQHLTGRQAVGAIDMFGRIRRPDGQMVYLRNSTLLEIPNDPARMITGRTTAFLVGMDDVSISTVTAGFAD